MPTIKDIAKLSGFSISTVSYALDDHPKISKNTKDKIKEIAKEINYVPNAFARGLKSKKCKNIGIFIPGFKGPVHPTILSGIAEIIDQTNNEYKLLITLADSEFKLIREKLVDIAIIIDSRITDELVHELSRVVPIVLFDKIVEIRNVYNTYIENYEGVYNCIINFYKSGIKKFMFISGSFESFHNKERLRGYNEAIRKCELNADDQIVLDAKSFTEEAGYLLFKDYLINNILNVECIVCSNDELALGVMKALKEKDYQIPQDVKIIGFDNIDKGQYSNPSLSTIEVNWFEYGKEIGKLVMNILQGIKVKKRINITTSFIKRESI